MRRTPPITITSTKSLIFIVKLMFSFISPYTCPCGVSIFFIKGPIGLNPEKKPVAVIADPLVFV